MNDRAIIKAISRIHFTIVSFFIFILIIGSFLFISLLNGIRIDHLKLPGIQIDELYINWNEKLCLNASSIDVKFNDSNESTSFKPEKLKAVIQALKLYDNWFESVEITSFSYNNINASFSYLADEKSHLYVASPQFEVDSDIHFLTENIFFNINYFNAPEHKSSLQGSMVFDSTELTLYIQAEASVAQSADLAIYSIVDKNAVTIELQGIKPIRNLRPIINLFKLHKDVTPWIVDYSAGTAFNLHSLSARYEYDHPESLLESINATADYQDFVYTFQPGLDPIVTAYTDFVFKHGVLNIFPREASYCGQNTGESWLNIDFNPDDEPVLTAYLHTAFKLNDDIIYLLNYFGIALPFKQLSGNTKADLTLRVPLLSINIDAKGHFSVDKGNFLYKGIDLNITDSAIDIHNSKVSVKRFHVDYKDNLRASAKGFLNFSTGESNLDFIANKISIENDKMALDLNNSKDILQINYQLSNRGEHVSLSPSTWSLNGMHVKVGSLRAPFDFEHFSIGIPSTSITVKDILQADISADINVENLQSDFKINLRQFHYKALKLNQPNLHMRIKQSDQLDINITHSSSWLIDDTLLESAPFKISIKDSRLTVSDNRFFIGDSLQGDLSGSYDLADKNGSLALSNFIFTNSSLSSFFAHDERIDVKIEHQNESTHIQIPKLKTFFKIKEDGWRLNFYSLSALAEHSPILQEYNITKGSLIVESSTGDDSFSFVGNIDYPYSLLIQNDRPQNLYSFDGTYDGESLQIDVNQDLNITVNDEIHIRSKNIGFNVTEFIAYLDEHQQSSSDETNTGSGLVLYIDASNSFLLLDEKRRALADGLSVHYKDKLLSAQMMHRQGKMTLKMEEGQFKLKGQDFNELFINSLFEEGYFKGGNLSFWADGNLSSVNGVVRLKNTTVRQHRLLNNLFAFINTIPALVTFSVPRYSKSGFKINEAYGTLSYKDKKLTVKGIKIDGIELDITGDGLLDYNTDTIDIDLSLKTQAGMNVGKIPLLGYILVGDDDTKMTSFKLKGDIDNPEVTNTMAKDIVVAPFNILKRAISLPFAIFDWDNNESFDDSGYNLLKERLNEENEE